MMLLGVAGWLARWTNSNWAMHALPQHCVATCDALHSLLTFLFVLTYGSMHYHE